MDTQNLPLANETPEQRDIRMNKDVAAFGYVWIMSIAVYAARKDSKFAQFHSKQGLVLFLISIPVWIIPGIGHYLTILVVAGMLLGFINAAQGNYTDVPFAGPLSRGELTFKDIMHGINKVLDMIVSVFRSIFKHAAKDSAAENAPKTPAPAAPATPKSVDTPPVTPVP